jgi:hypothetical protein
MRVYEGRTNGQPRPQDHGRPLDERARLLASLFAVRANVVHWERELARIAPEWVIPLQPEIERVHRALTALMNKPPLGGLRGR